MDRAVAGKDRTRHARQEHRDEGADDRGVRGNAELQDQLHADDRAENAQHDQEDKGRRREGRGMLRLGDGGRRHGAGNGGGAGQITHRHASCCGEGAPPLSHGMAGFAYGFVGGSVGGSVSKAGSRLPLASPSAWPIIRGRRV
jgi:hypothetical protein